MFLPHNLASSVRHSKRSKKLNSNRTTSEGNSESGIMASTPSPRRDTVTSNTSTDIKSGKKRNKKSKAASSSSPTHDSPPNQSFVARGWARISRRGKRTKRDSMAGILPGVSHNDVTDVGLHRPDPCTSSSVSTTTPSTAEGRNSHSAASIDDNHNRNIVSRGMDKLRRSFRKSFRRSKGQALTTPSASLAPASHVDGKSSSKASSSTGPNCVVETSACSIHNGKTYCQPDEAAVRSAACSFQVKYLGAVEVFESRGMHVCEGALQQLRTKKRQTKAVLYVTGDGIRVVDQESNRGLILDQTIEKVSFCAPDRHNDRGFAYICREGATKRWMCHGFHSMKESGERLSHAVGCAFTICLEKKRKRDAETAAYRSGQALALITNASASNFDKAFESAATSTSNSSLKDAAALNKSGSMFRRQLSIAERKLDPQTAIIVKNNVTASGTPRSLSDMTGADIPDASRLAASPLVGTAAAAGATVNGSLQFPAQFTVNGDAFTTTVNTPTPSSTEPFSTVKPRPAANPSLFDRQGSFKAPLQSSSSNSFKRFNSLRADLIGPTGSNRLSGLTMMHNEPIYEGDDDNLSAELCSLNFGAPPMGFPQNLNTFTTTTSCLPTSQTFGGSNTLPSEFTEQFTRNSEKRASRADEWLAQLLQTSTAGVNNPAQAPSQQQSFSAQQIPNNFGFSNTTGYFNPATQMTPSNLFTAAPFKQNIPHSQSVDVYMTSNLAQTASNASGPGLSGPPPNQPPPPLPPSVASRLNGILPGKVGLTSTATTTISARSNNDQTDSLGFVQNIIKSPSKYGLCTGNTGSQEIAVENMGNTPLRSTKTCPTQRNTAGNLKADASNPTASQGHNGHTRKSSAARMSIEYQLLEETDAPPQSPPRVDSPQFAALAVDRRHRPLQITPFGSGKKLDSFGQCVFNAPSTSAAALTTIPAQNSHKQSNGNSSSKGNEENERCTLTISPTGAASAEAAIQAIRMKTRSSLESAESAISALHNSTKSDDPFDVKWSAEVLQMSTLHNNGPESAQGVRKIEQQPPIATNN